MEENGIKYRHNQLNADSLKRLIKLSTLTLWLNFILEVQAKARIKSNLYKVVQGYNLV
jgi:hypothetical protein